MKRKLITVGCLILSAVVSARAQHHEDHGHDHPRNEVGLSLGASYGIEHQEWAPAIHAHFFRAFTPHSRWAWGAGAEYLPGHENHFEIGAGAWFQPLDNLQLSLMPGVSVAGKARFSLHAEAAWEAFHLGNFHLGPVAGYAWAKDHSHVSVGIHAAVAFGGKHKLNNK